MSYIISIYYWNIKIRKKTIRFYISFLLFFAKKNIIVIYLVEGHILLVLVGFPSNAMDGLVSLRNNLGSGV